jgi:hypothetical protein
MQKSTGADNPNSYPIFCNMFAIIGSFFVLLGVLLGALTVVYLPLTTIAIMNSLTTVLSTMFESCFLGVEFDVISASSIILIIPGIIIALIGADIIDLRYTPHQLNLVFQSVGTILIAVVSIGCIIVGLFACQVGRKKDAPMDVALYGRVLASATAAAWYTLLFKAVLEVVFFLDKYGSAELAGESAFFTILVILLVGVGIMKVSIVSMSLNSFHVLLFTPLFQVTCFYIFVFIFIMYIIKIINL